MATILLTIMFGYFGFGSLGQLVAGAYMAVAPAGELWGLLLYVIALALAIGCVSVSARPVRIGANLTSFARGLLVSFAWFFCPQLAIIGWPDWSFAALSVGVALCFGAGAAALWLSGRYWGAPPSEPPAQPTSVSSGRRPLA